MEEENQKKGEQKMEKQREEKQKEEKLQYSEGESRSKFLIFGFAVAVIISMILICTISYSSIKVQANTGFKYYTGITVKSGETLWSIADKYIDYAYYEDKAAYINEIECINHLDDDEMLLAGQLLIIPYYSSEFM